jgi:hypothetical protein
MKYHATCGRFSLMINTDEAPPDSQVAIMWGKDQSLILSISELEDLRYMIARSQEPQTRAEHERHR